MVFFTLRGIWSLQTKVVSVSGIHATLIVAYFGTLLFISKGVRVNISDKGLVRLRTAEHVMVAAVDSPPLQPRNSYASALGTYAGSCVANGRRRFLNACLILGAARIDSAMCTTSRYFLVPGEPQVIGKSKRVVHLRHTVAEIGDADAYYQLRATLARNAINPWLRCWMEKLDDELPHGFEAIMGMRQEDGELNSGPLLDFSEWFWTEQEIHAAKNGLSFDQWLLEFHPAGRDDFLMALPLYYLYQHSGTVIPRVLATPDPWLDAMLNSTRGMLLWTSQWVDLLRVIGNIGEQGACRLIKDYMLGRPNASVVLEQIRYFAAGLSFMQIIEERSPTRRPVGSPDYVAADWLQQNWSKA